MSKTNPKMELVSTEETTEFKKTRMKEVRAMVSNALRKNQRIDLMDFTGTDIPRVMVALQDEVMKARERHQKATKHIAGVKQDMALIMPIITMTLQAQGQVINDLTAELEVQGERIEDEQEHSINLYNENVKLRNTVEVLR